MYNRFGNTNLNYKEGIAMRNFGGLAVIMVAAFLMTGCAAEVSQNGVTATSTVTSTATVQKQEPKQEPALKFVEKPTSVCEEYTCNIIGKLQNKTNKTFSYVEVEFTIYDADGNQIGTALDNIKNLEPGATWMFKALIFEDDADSFKLTKVISW